MDPEQNKFMQHEQSGQRLREREAAMRRIDEGERPWMEEVGVLSVVDAVRDLRFPATADQILEKAGDRDVRTSEEARIPLAYVLPKLQQREFASIRDFEQAVVRHWEGIEFAERGPRSGSRTSPPGADID